MTNRLATALIRLPVSATLLILVCATGALSVRALAGAAWNADTLDLAASIESGSSLSAVSCNSSPATASIRASSDCGDAFTRASLTINLAALDAARAENNLALADAALASAIRGRRSGSFLRCDPLDGNAWLRDAMA